ncbi:sulfhydryl oxidase 2-like isoform X1 [Cynara cardunculus var. scolymus]|uniref:sulfhydryl oxidase 2-like isoform X1 n=1 Tax=Cynara cardunculus var. scolymus TaxID=59895 RepID=UPI000D630107|nr:sulfhydryl oxidase 2-like isoform X1 [Cynara cardunculus var. scolymus]
MSSVFKLLTLLLWSFMSLSLISSALLINPAAGSRSLLRAINGGGDQPDFAVDLNVTNFDAVLKDTPATYAIVEFFAHWCPACRNYKPQYEKVARLFNGANAIHPGVILMTRVDCANKVNINLCDKFSISHYPSLFWGPPSKFVGGGWDGKSEKSEIHPIDDGRTADRLLKWINTRLGSSYSFEDEKYKNDALLQSNVSDPGQIARAVYDVEESTSVAFDIIMEHKMIKPDTRATLIKFMQLMVAHHPSRRCRMGSADILVSFDDLYPSRMWSASKHEYENGTRHGLQGKFNICGKEVPRGYWMFCRGSKNDTRGFSCGLWVLLHSLSVRVEDGESQMAFTTTCDFIHQFFICEECRQHFHSMCSRVSTPFSSTRDFVLWLWTTHNEVNKRLKKEEASLETGDPKFPKAIWPSKRLCPTCYASQNQNEESSSIDWDLDEVFKFLGNYYGKTLVSLYKEKDKEILSHTQKKTNAVSEDMIQSTNALVVPVGAALAIAVASCLFGALACFWRSQQKNRKYFHKPQLLKIV